VEVGATFEPLQNLSGESAGAALVAVASQHRSPGELGIVALRLVGRQLVSGGCNN
jgi:hypothetical protein